MEINNSSVLIFGGYGVFGSRIAADLIEHTDCKVIIAGRNLTQANNLCARLGSRAIPMRCDLGDLESVKQAVSRVQVIILAAGPFQNMPPAALEAAIACRVHYIDLADDRQYLQQVRSRRSDILNAGISVLAGLSTVSGISAVFARWGSQVLGGADSVHVALSPGNRNPRGTGTIASVLSSVGRSIQIWRQGRWSVATGWTGREPIEFPAPVGRRFVYWVDGPDYELLPPELGCQEVVFKAGLELDLLNHNLALLGTLRHRWPAFPLERYAKLLIWLSLLISSFGTPHGAFRVQVRKADQYWTVWTVAQQNGPMVAATPAAVAAAALLRGDIKQRGLISPSQWISPTVLVEELEKRGMSIAVSNSVSPDFRPKREQTALSPVL